MALKKAIEHNKTKRKPYYGSKRFDPSCRNHGGCVWCARGRAHKNEIEKERAEDMEKMQGEEE